MLKRKKKQVAMKPIDPQYEFRVVENAHQRFTVEAQTTNYNYGEDLADYGWTNAGEHPTLKYDFARYYDSLDSAIYAIKNYRDEDRVVWSEREEEKALTQKERLEAL